MAKVDPARRVAFHTLREVTAAGAYANLALSARLAQAHLNERDAAFATELVFGTCRWCTTLDQIIVAASGRALKTLQPAVVDILRLGAQQLLNLRIPAHAALSESVELARAELGNHATGVVNAILRRVGSHDLESWCQVLLPDPDPIDWLALRYAHPRWIVETYAELLPAVELETALAANNAAAQPVFAVRPSLVDRNEFCAATGGTPTRFSPWGLRLAQAPGEVAEVRSGLVGVQDEGSQLVCLALSRAGIPAGSWLDQCAGPGGKAALLRGLAPSDTLLVANEIQPHRARLVAQALRCYDRSGHQVCCADATQPPWGTSFALVLVDAPCSGLGALRRRPEARWRHPASIISELAPLQDELFATAARSLVPGGVLAWVTCSPHPAETCDVVLRGAHQFGLEILDAPALLPEVPNAAASTDRRFIQLWPHRHDTDAMYCALLTRPVELAS